MAKNIYGFIQKKYRQPTFYKEFFCHYNAVYVLENGTELMVEARPHFLVSEHLGALIDHYQILVREPDCRRVLKSDIKTQKKAMELLEKYIEKYSK